MHIHAPEWNQTACFRVRVYVDRQTQTDTDRHRQTQTDRKTGRQADRQTGRQTETDRDKQRQTDRQDILTYAYNFTRLQNN